MEPLDSDSLVEELRLRNPKQSWKLRDADTLPQQKHSLKTLKQQQFKIGRLCNERYDFKLTHQQHEVRLTHVKGVIDSVGQWAKSTDQHCNYDGQPFSGPPAAVPVNCIKGVWQTQGCFCSWSCARSWLESTENSDRRLQLLRELAYRYFGITTVYPALPLKALRIYGGTMELEEWRAAAHSRNSTILYEPPLEPLDEIVLERIQDWEVRKQHNEHYYGRNQEERRQKELARQQKLEQDLKIAADRESSRLRKQASSKNTLFQTMGITLID